MACPGKVANYAHSYTNRHALHGGGTERDPDCPENRRSATPAHCSFNTWGDEIYFAIPVDATWMTARKTSSHSVIWATGPLVRHCVFSLARPQ